MFTFSFSHFAFLSAEFRMPNGALLSNSTRKIFARAAKDDAKIA